MTTLLEIRENLKLFVGKYEIYIVAVAKAILAFAVFMVIRNGLGYSSRFGSITIVLALSLLCALLPSNFILLFSALLVLVNLYSVSKAAAIMAAAVFVILLLLHFRFSPTKGYYAAIPPVAYALNVPYVMPVAAGLLDRTPSSIMAMCSGTISYYMLHGIAANASVLAEESDDRSLLTDLQTLASQLFNNKEMMVMIVITALAAVVVWVIRRLSIDYAWTIAIAVGLALQFVMRLICNFQFKLEGGVLILLLQTLVSAVIGLILQFFFYNLNFARTERVQFEDDEYYYYVKAVPKQSVSSAEITVKRFGGERAEDEEDEEEE